MNKKILLFIFLSLFCFMPLKTNALSFIANDKEYEVTDLETYRDYIYFEKIKPNYNSEDSSTYNYKYLICGYDIFYNYHRYKCLFKVSKTDSKYFPYVGDDKLIFMDNSYAGSVKIDFGTNIVGNSNNYSTEQGQMDFKSDKGYFSNVTIKHENSSYDLEDYLQPNFTYEDIENKYVVQEEPTEEPTNVNISFPIDKEEFYVLLVLIATLIMMLFLKWCFPMKGGKKI